MKQLPKSAIIIGAGIGGLAIANLLARAGVAVTIFEQQSGPGGRAGIKQTNGFTFDTGPSWFLMPEAFSHFYKLLGEDIHEHIDLTRLDPAYKVFFDGHDKPIAIHANAKKDQATFEQIEPGAGLALKRYLEQADTTYGLAIKHFLYTNFTQPLQLLHPTIFKHVPRMARITTRPIDKHTRKFVQDQRLRQILEYPMVFLGTSPFQAPALYSLMSHMDFTQGVYYPMGGLHTIITSLEKLALQAGVKINYNCAVQAIKTKDRQATGVSHKRGQQSADIIISNADLHFTETQLLPKSGRQYSDKYWRKRTPSPSAILMYLGVQGSLPQLEHHNLFFSKKWRQNFDDIFTHKRWPEQASMYVCKPSATDTSVAPQGYENVFVLVPVQASEQHDKETTAKQAEHYLDQLAQHIGEPRLQEKLVVKEFFGPEDFSAQLNAWQGNALGLAHTLRQSAFFRPSNKSRALSNLYYVGGDITPGVGLPMCLIGAENLYKRLIGDNSSAPLQAAIQHGGTA